MVIIVDSLQYSENLEVDKLYSHSSFTSVEIIISDYLGVILMKIFSLVIFVNCIPHV